MKLIINKDREYDNQEEDRWQTVRKTAAERRLWTITEEFKKARTRKQE